MVISSSVFQFTHTYELRHHLLLDFNSHIQMNWNGKFFQYPTCTDHFNSHIHMNWNIKHNQNNSYILYWVVQFICMCDNIYHILFKSKQNIRRYFLKYLSHFSANLMGFSCKLTFRTRGVEPVPTMKSFFHYKFLSIYCGL